MPEQEVKLMDYAVVENGIITNVLVFDNEQTAEEFGCLPLAPYQGIGDVYITPEEYAKQEQERRIRDLVDSI